MRRISTTKGSVRYMNSGDWIEHMSALEFVDGKWSLYVHDETAHVPLRAKEFSASTLVEVY